MANLRNLLEASNQVQSVLLHFRRAANAGFKVQDSRRSFLKILKLESNIARCPQMPCDPEIFAVVS